MILWKLNSVSPCPRRRSTRTDALAQVKSFAGLTVLSSLVAACSCLPVGDPVASLVVRGVLLDAGTLAGATGAVLGIETFMNKERTGFEPPYAPLLTADGSFDLVVARTQRDPFPRPDRIVIIVVRGGCEQRFMIDINADTVVDPTAPDDVLELKEPILVPPCPP